MLGIELFLYSTCKQLAKICSSVLLDAFRKPNEVALTHLQLASSSSGRSLAGTSFLGCLLLKLGREKALT